MGDEILDLLSINFPLWLVVQKPGLEAKEGQGRIMSVALPELDNEVGLVVFRDEISAGLAAEKLDGMIPAPIAREQFLNYLRSLQPAGVT
jgi:hypothetical protein